MPFVKTPKAGDFQNSMEHKVLIQHKAIRESIRHYFNTGCQCSSKQVSDVVMCGTWWI